MGRRVDRRASATSPTAIRSRAAVGAHRRRARLGRHPDQQRRHARPRRAVPRPAAGALGARSARQPDRRVQLRPGGVAAHEGAAAWGRIVNMASVAGTLGGFGQASYSTTKAGLLGLTKTLAMEGGRHGITANAIVPGIIGTEAFHMANAAMNERIANRTVFKRPGEPQDIANAIAFLCSDLAGVHHRHRAQRLGRRRAVRVRQALLMAAWPPRHRPFVAVPRRGTRPWTRIVLLGGAARLGRGGAAALLRRVARRISRAGRGSPGVDVGRALAAQGADGCSRLAPAGSTALPITFVAGRIVPADGARARRRGRLGGGGCGSEEAGRRDRPRARLPASLARVLPAGRRAAGARLRRRGSTTSSG